MKKPNLSIPRRESLFVGIVLFLTLGIGVSAQASFGGPNPISLLLLGTIIFAVCSVVLGTARIFIYQIWHSQSGTRAKKFYLASSAVEISGCFLFGFLFHFDTAVMLILLTSYFCLESFVNPLVMRWFSPSLHSQYLRNLPLSLVQAFLLPSLGLIVYVLAGFTQ